MKYFEEPKIDVQKFEATDVITASGCEFQGGEVCPID